MSKNNKHAVKVVVSILVSLTALIGIIVLLMRGQNAAIMAPAGVVAAQQRELIIWTLLLSLFVVVPVFGLTFYIAWKYRASNEKATYSPGLHGSAKAEAVWWLVPLLLISVLSLVIWKTSHSLDPYKRIQAEKEPVTIQVVALDWKWLFLYPEEGVATVNHVTIPIDTPVRFQITADAPMNSFWVPQLGSQVYAMAGMRTELNVMANKFGTFRGSSANLSGEGFSGMKFNVDVTDEDAYRVWIDDMRNDPDTLSYDAYKTLAKPSKNNPVEYYGTYDKKLYGTILMKYMMPGHGADPADKDHDAAHDAQNTRQDAGNEADVNSTEQTGHSGH